LQLELLAIKQWQNCIQDGRPVPHLEQATGHQQKCLKTHLKTFQNMDIKKPTNIIKAIDFYIPRFKGMETISQAKDEDTFAAFCHSQLSG
jgi:hypothetical protein